MKLQNLANTAYLEKGIEKARNLGRDAGGIDPAFFSKRIKVPFFVVPSLFKNGVLLAKRASYCHL